MVIYIDLVKLKEIGLSPSLYCYLYMLNSNSVIENFYSEEAISYMNTILEESNFIKIIDDKILVRKKGVDIFQEPIVVKNSIETWIDEWRNIFPSGVKSGGRPVRGDRSGVLTKMQAFVKQNPQYTSDQIFDATKQYVFESSLKSYNFIICADYFIKKNNSSMLAAMIEELEIKGSSYKKLQEGNSGSNWHKEI